MKKRGDGILESFIENWIDCVFYNLQLKNQNTKINWNTIKNRSNGYLSLSFAIGWSIRKKVEFYVRLMRVNLIYLVEILAGLTKDPYI